MTRFDGLLRQGLMDANLAQYGRVLRQAEDEEPDFSPRYLRERIRLLSSPQGWAEPRRRRLDWRLVAIAAALLILSACAYAVATGQFTQWFPGMRMDPEAPEVSEDIAARMGTVIGQSQTVGGATVTLNAAVWDGRTLLLSLMAEGLELPQGFSPNDPLYDLECRFLLAEDQREAYLRKKVDEIVVMDGPQFTEAEREDMVQDRLNDPNLSMADVHLGVSSREGNALALQISMGFFAYVDQPEVTLHIENVCTYQESDHGYRSWIDPDGAIHTDPETDAQILSGPYDFTFTLDQMIPPAVYTGDVEVTYENIPMRVSKITITPFEVRADFETLTQVEISFEQIIAMSLNGLWTEEGEYIECLGGATTNTLPDGRTEGEMMSALLHLADPDAVTAVDIGGTRVELSELELSAG